MWRLFYSLLLIFSLPFIVLRLLIRSTANRRIERGLANGFLFDAPEFDRENTTLIWLHAVSVGETVAALPLVKSLQAKHANLRFVITTTTPTGSDRVRSLFGETVFHVYAPYDLNSCCALPERSSRTCDTDGNRTVAEYDCRLPTAG